MSETREYRYKTDDITVEVEKAAKEMLDNQAFTMLVSTKLKSLAQDVLDCPPGEQLNTAKWEYDALKAWAEWVEYAAE